MGRRRFSTTVFHFRTWFPAVIFMNTSRNIISFCCILLVCTFHLFLCPIPLQAQVNTVGLLLGSGGLGDQSYNDMTFTGLGKAQKEYGFALLVEETFGTEQSQKSALASLIQQSADVIVANGAGLHLQIVDCAPDYPNRYFIVNDHPISDYQNIASTVFAHQEGSYLAGLLAAAYSKTGMIGFIGGVDLPKLHEFLNGYTLGAKSISSDIDVSALFVAPPDDYSGFENPGRGMELASQMFQANIDVIFAVAGLTGNGIIQAAVKHDRMVIGVDSNQDHMAKGHVLTSMMKRLDRSTYEEISRIMEGKFKPGIKYYSLHNGGISLTPMQFTRHLLSDRTLQRLQQAEEDIIHGKIRFP